MKLIIDIPEKTLKYYVTLANKGEQIGSLERIVLNGTPFDLDGLKSDMKVLNCGFPYGLDYLLDCLNKRLGITITESDRGSDTE